MYLDSNNSLIKIHNDDFLFGILIEQQCTQPVLFYRYCR